MGRTLSQWMSASACVAGRSHERTGTPCQDAAGVSSTNKVRVVALADGAGSARHADVGAQICVTKVLEHVPKRFHELASADTALVREEIIDEIRRQIEATAHDNGAAIGDYSSTLLFVAVEGERYIAGHVGDGIIACEKNGRSEVLTRPYRGEHANETVFVTSRDAPKFMTLVRGDLDGRFSFALMSDGSAESLYVRRDGTLAPALRTLWGWLDRTSSVAVKKALETNLRDLFRERTGDDCSLALLRRVCLPAEQVLEMDRLTQRDLLDCSSGRVLKTRLAVLKALLDRGNNESMISLARRASVSPTTARRHTKELAAMLQSG